ncbi:MAG: ATP-dependent helicase/nuclease subunit A [Phycisphaerae bacterium]|nr:MAG: helicase-exonuclease AddAB subunit AddA [Planctomycetia bacterium]RIK67221.1 MAG: helicase-exonuclease AddAB subunit AddA [Planctomycetota bacterium]GJQ27235.1 MAG: ATP-dependent helicase/nuclease subunit A [Phycisphaerae bacterium]
MSAIRWTPSQCAAIETLGVNVLVSAGAGSGKTAVLAERCARLMADETARCGVERFLVVTFTDAAAAEMRERIGLALRERLAREPGNSWLARQLALLDTAAISTLHSFCRRTLNRHFAEVDLEPQAPLLDENESAMLRRETAKQALDELATLDGAAGEAVLEFLGAYGSAGDRRLLDAVERLNAFLASLPDPDAWCAGSLARYDADGAAWQREWLAALQSELTEQSAVVKAVIARLMAARPKAEALIVKMLEWIEPFDRSMDAWRRCVSRPSANEAALDGLIGEISNFQFGRLDFKRWAKEVSNDAVSALEPIRDELKAIKERYFAGRLRRDFGGLSRAQAKAGLARIAPHIRTLFAIAARARDAYATAKHQLAAIDFADLERYTLDLLRNDAAGVARRLRDRFEHVLVDEFQDINPVQAEIIRLISREDDTGRPGNLFCVGDVKQSIYRFRLAEPRLFLRRAEAYGSGVDDRGRRIDLVENFRSRPAVLEAVNAVFEKIMAQDLGEIDYDDRARLKPGRTESADAEKVTPVELHLLETPRRGDESDHAAAGESSDDAAGSHDSDSPDSDGEAVDWLQIEREAYVIADRIAALAAEGVRYGDIVVLLRSLQPRAGALVRTLARRGIPVRSESDRGLFEALEVRDVLSFLALLDNARQDIPLAAVMRGPLLGEPFSDDDLAMIRSSSRDSDFHESVVRYVKHDEDRERARRVADFLETIQTWRDRARQLTPADLLWRLYEETGYLAYVSGLRDGAQRRANLVCLHDLARQFGAFQRQGLRRFLEFIAAMKESDRDLARGSVSAGDEDAVQVMSIHRSKGLEFPVVIVGELGKRINFGDAREAVLMDRRLGLALKAVDLEQYITYPTIAYKLVARSLTEEALAEELRVLYVAMTRAKQRLILVGSGNIDSIDDLRRRYAGSFGALPLIERRSASTMLDWVLPAICAQPNDRVRYRATVVNDRDASPGSTGGPPELFDVVTYSTDAMADWKLDTPIHSASSTLLGAAATLAPLPAPAAGAGERAKEIEQIVATVRRRLETSYAFEPMTRLPAVAAASVLKRRWDTREDPQEPTAAWRATKSTATSASTAGRVLPLPRFAQSKPEPDARQRGTLTHEFLQRLDLTRPCDAAGLQDQLLGLINAGVVSADDASQIDLDNVAWFFTTDLGQRMRRPGARVKREWPFVMAVDPRRYDPAIVTAGAVPAGDAAQAGDRMLVRGIVDCFFDAGEGWEIVDYKTDAVSGADVAERAALYRGQLAIYAEALAATFPGSALRCWLVFLSAREIVNVDEPRRADE